ncbi:MAG: hypothetical protein N3C12_14555 [Candidatus Binatia bacterium]|nr:hypothetical protein [Candidatus Binatia bacterium]
MLVHRRSSDHRDQTLSLRIEHSFDNIKPHPRIMRKGTALLLWLALPLLLLGIWLSGVRLTGQIFCEKFSALPLTSGGTSVSCHPASWIWPRIRLWNLRSSALVSGGSFELRWSVPEAVLTLDEECSWEIGTFCFRARIHQPTLVVHAVAGKEQTAFPTLALPLFQELASASLVGRQLALEIDEGTIDFDAGENSGGRQPVVRDLRGSLEPKAENALRLVWGGRVGGAGSPARANLALAFAAGATKIELAGSWRVFPGLLLEVPNSRIEIAEGGVSLREVHLRLNGAPVNLSGTIGWNEDQPRSLAMEWRKIQIGPLIDALWADLRGTLQGELAGTLRAVPPPCGRFLDPSHWTVEAHLSARRLHWSGVNLLYGLLSTAYHGLSGDKERLLPQALRQTFPSELLLAETVIERAEASLQFERARLTIASLNLHGFHFDIAGSGTITAETGVPEVAANFTLATSPRLSAELCRAATEYCNLTTANETLRLHYRWQGNPNESLPEWLPEASP